MGLPENLTSDLYLIYFRSPSFSHNVHKSWAINIKDYQVNQQYHQSEVWSWPEPKPQEAHDPRRNPPPPSGGRRASCHFRSVMHCGPHWGLPEILFPVGGYQRAEGWGCRRWNVTPTLVSVTGPTRRDEGGSRHTGAVVAVTLGIATTVVVRAVAAVLAVWTRRSTTSCIVAGSTMCGQYFKERDKRESASHLKGRTQYDRKGVPTATLPLACELLVQGERWAELWKMLSLKIQLRDTVLELQTRASEAGRQWRPRSDPEEPQEAGQCFVGGSALEQPYGRFLGAGPHHSWQRWSWKAALSLRSGHPICLSASKPLRRGKETYQGLRSAGSWAGWVSLWQDVI